MWFWVDGTTGRSAYRLKGCVGRGEDGYYVGYCPGVRGLVSQGTTKAEARANLEAAAQDYMEVLEEL